MVSEYSLEYSVNSCNNNAPLSMFVSANGVPYSASLCCPFCIKFDIFALISGNVRRMCDNKMLFNFFARYGIPILCATDLYAGWLSKNSFSLSNACVIGLFDSISLCPLFTTPIKSCFNCITFPDNMSIASVPSSIMSSFVSTPIVLFPCGSTLLAIFNASEFAISPFAGVTANIMQFCCFIKCNTMFLICSSMSFGWFPTGTFVIPGKSISVKFSTFGE
mmetsp:Transcript_4349/g.6392  ORF Transcript_4349/g.6392 Transcript_4349/m.6392 type:complete len:220 (-) Transcript_4349:406-1065(-)